jgi:serine/threonine protein kinase
MNRFVLPAAAETRFMATSPPIGAEVLSVEQFAKCWAESGLLPAAEVSSLAARVPAAQRGDCRPFAGQLVRLGKLTAYQSSMLCQGRSKGLVLDNYAILDKIGQGGMGMVFKALNRRLARVVALKVLPPSVTKKGHALERFQREVRVASKLHHPNIVAAYDAGADKGVYFLVMEYVDGSDLASLVKTQGPLPVGLAIHCAVQAVRGLEYAHAAGIIHRDIKPANLLVSGGVVSGRVAGGSNDNSAPPPLNVKILDMGLARSEDAGNTPAAAEELTEAGSFLGTSDYTAPEQAANSKNADQRSDIYSLGCTLYFLLTGQVMYAGGTMIEKLLAHRSETIPSLRKLRPDVSRALDNVYQRMVAKKPEDRYPSMSAVAAALDSCLTPADRAVAANGLPQRAGTPLVPASSVTDTQADNTGSSGIAERKRSPRHWWIIGAGAAVAAVAAIVTAGVVTLALVKAFTKGDRPPSDTSKNVVDVSPTDTGKTAVTPPDTGKHNWGADEAWVRSVAVMPIRQQWPTFVEKMRQLNPGMRPRVDRRIEKGGIVEIAFDADQVVDISPVRALSKLQELTCSGSADGRGKLGDLSPLKGMQLRQLNCSRNPSINDLSALKGMPLHKLTIGMTGVGDLSPLAGMPLESLDITGTGVRDLSPLRGLPLTQLHLRRTPVDDLTPLKGMALVEISVDPRNPRFFDVLRAIPTLKTINDQPVPPGFHKVGGK